VTNKSKREIIYRGSRSTVTLEKGVCTKRALDKNLSQEFIDQYQKFSKDKDYYLKVFEIKNKQSYTMEYLDIDCTAYEYVDHHANNQIEEKICNEIFKIFLQVQLDCIEFSKTLGPGQHWIQKDLHLRNLVILKDKKVKLIDVDSFMISHSPIDAVYNSSFAMLASRLQHIYDTKKYL